MWYELFILYYFKVDVTLSYKLVYYIDNFIYYKKCCLYHDETFYIMSYTLHYIVLYNKNNNDNNSIQLYYQQ